MKTGRIQDLRWNIDYKNKIESLGDLIKREKLQESEFEEIDPDIVENILIMRETESDYVDIVLDEKAKPIKEVYVGDKITDNMNLKTATKLFPETMVEESMENEFKGYLETDSVEPTDEDGLRGVIRSHGFFKAKTDAKTGEVTSLKYRQVANGKEKKQSGFYEMFDRDFSGHTQDGVIPQPSLPLMQQKAESSGY